MADPYWRLAASGGLPPAGGMDPRRDFPEYNPFEPAGRDIPGYLPHESSQPTVRDLPGYLPRDTVRDLSGYLPRESSQSAVRDIPGYLPRENLQPAVRDLSGYLPREISQFDERIGHSMWRAHDPLGHPPESLRDGVSPYRAAGQNASEIGGSGVGLGGVTGSLGLGSGSGISLVGVPGAAASARMVAPAVEDPVLMAQRQSVDPAHAGRTASAEYYAARKEASLRLLDSARPDASSRLPENLRPNATTNTIFVEGLPPDCTRREVAHIFRPFIGFKQIRVIHKEPRRAGGEPYVLCFVEFADEKCAATALKALQGYKFDDVDHDSNPLKLQFAHFPGTRPITAPVVPPGVPQQQCFMPYAVLTTNMRPFTNTHGRSRMLSHSILHSSDNATSVWYVYLQNSREITNERIPQDLLDVTSMRGLVTILAILANMEFNILC